MTVHALWPFRLAFIPLNVKYIYAFTANLNIAHRIILSFNLHFPVESRLQYIIFYNTLFIFGL